MSVIRSNNCPFIVLYNQKRMRLAWSFPPSVKMKLFLSKALTFYFFGEIS